MQEMVRLIKLGYVWVLVFFGIIFCYYCFVFCLLWEYFSASEKNDTKILSDSEGHLYFMLVVNQDQILLFHSFLELP